MDRQTHTVTRAREDAQSQPRGQEIVPPRTSRSCWGTEAYTLRLRHTAWDTPPGEGQLEDTALSQKHAGWPPAPQT